MVYNRQKQDEKLEELAVFSTQERLEEWMAEEDNITMLLQK